MRHEHLFQALLVKPYCSPYANNGSIKLPFREEPSEKSFAHAVNGGRFLDGQPRPVLSLRRGRGGRIAGRCVRRRPIWLDRSRSGQGDQDVTPAEEIDVTNPPGGHDVFQQPGARHRARTRQRLDRLVHSQ